MNKTFMRLTAPVRIFFLLVHLWTTYIAFTHGGLWQAVLSFVGFIVAEFYWAYQLWGSGLYPVVAAIAACAITVTMVGGFIYGAFFAAEEA